MLFAIPAQALQWNWVEHETPSYFSDNGNGHFRRVITGKTLPDGSLMKSNAKASNRSQEYHGDIITEVPATAEVKYYSRSGFYHAYDNIYAETAQSGMTAIAFDGNDVYIQNPIAGFSNNNWVKGTKDGNTITVPLKQFLLYNSSESYGLYITMADVTTSGTSVTATNDKSAESITYTISADGNTITQNGTSATRTLTVAWSDDDTVYEYGAPGGEYTTVFTWDESYVPTPTVLVELPAGAEVAQWYAEGDGSTTPPEQVNVAFVGDDVYVGGLFANFPDAWIKGTISGTTATFPGLQYIGDSDTYHIWVVGANQDGELTDSFTMTFDATANTLTLDPNQYILANASDTKMYYLAYYSELMLMKDEPAPLQVDVLPYNNDFSTKAKFREFKVIDANNDNVTWLSYNGMARISYATPNDDWLVSPLIKLQAGKFYHISFLARCQLSSYPEKIEVKAAKEITAAALSAGLEVLPETDVTSTTFTTFENNAFTVAETGYYCIGIHNISNDMFYCYVDDFLVEAVPATDIEISPESGDLTAALATASEGKNVGNITINLKADGAYTVSAPIVAPANLTINGAAGATIDASGNNAEVISLNGSDKYVLLGQDGEGQDVYDASHLSINAVTVKDVKMTGLKGALIKDNQKTLLGTLTIDNCNIEMPAAGKNVIDFNGKGYVGEVIVNKSTIWAAANNTGFFAQYGSRPNNFPEEYRANFFQLFNVQNSTIVNIAKGKNVCDLKQNGTANNGYTLKNNAFVDFGKEGQTVVGFNKGQTSANSAWDVDGNVFNWGGKDKSEAEVAKAGKKGEEDIVKNCIAGIVKFTDLATGDLNGTFGTFTAPTAETIVIGDSRWTYTLTQTLSDIVINAADITEGDITAAITAKSAGLKVGGITINLAENTAYTVTATITAGGSVAINGASGATIDASGLDGNFIALEGSEEFAMKADGTTPSDHYLVDAVTIKDVTVKGLKGALVKDNQKTYVNTLTIDNSVIEMPAAGKNVIDFSGKGYVATVTVNKSTIWAAGANTGFFAQYGSRPKNLWTKDAEDQDVPGIYDHQTFDVQNSTIVNIAKGKNVCDLKQNGTAQNIHTLKNNVFVDFGKEGQTVVGFNKGQTSDKPVWDVDGNVFNWGGKDKSAAEVEKAGKKGEEDIVKNSYAGVAVFNDAANGDFGGKFVVAPGATGPTTGIGDPRWTLTNVTGYAATIGECTGGTVKVDKDYAAEGDKIYATFTPAEGYSSSGIVAIIKNDAGEDVTSSITFGEDETGSYLIMPGFNITVSVVFQPLPKFYIIGDMNSWDRTAMTEMTYNAETEKFEFEFAPTTKVFFAFSDKQFTEAEAAADADWSIFNSTNRYALGEGDVEAPLNEIKTLSKVNGTIVLNKVKEGTTYKIIVEKDFNAVTIEGEAAPEPIEDTYVVAGSSDVLFGKTWDGTAEANKMTLNAETGKYEKKYTSVSLTAGNIEYKIVKNGSVWIPDGMGNNQIVEIPADGVYDVLFTFDPATNAITGVATIATGIYSISADGTNDIFSDGKPVYNLSGQRVFKGYKGVVIKNGKKVMIK